MDTENLLKAARKAAATNDAVLAAMSRIERDLLLLETVVDGEDAEASFKELDRVWARWPTPYGMGTWESGTPTGTGR